MGDLEGGRKAPPSSIGDWAGDRAADFRSGSRQPALCCRHVMPDPRALYIVVAVVFAGLAAWVISVLVRSERLIPLESPEVPKHPDKQDAS